jgi:hypothetical protein
MTKGEWSNYIKQTNKQSKKQGYGKLLHVVTKPSQSLLRQGKTQVTKGY